MLVTKFFLNRKPTPTLSICQPNVNFVVPPVFEIYAFTFRINGTSDYRFDNTVASARIRPVKFVMGLAQWRF